MNEHHARTAAACARLRPGPRRHVTLCMRCCRFPAVTMLSGYVIRGETCESCGYRGDLALVRLAAPFTT
jgi:MinD superfamily P-loop ATPase